MAGTEVTDLLLRIRGETQDAEAALGRVEQKLQQTSQTAKTTAENLSKVPEALNKGNSGNFNQIVSAFDQLQKTSSLTSKEIGTAAAAFTNLGKAGLDTKGGLGAVAAQLDSLSKAGKLSGTDIDKLKTTFGQLSSAGIKSGDDLNKLAGIYSSMTKESEALNAKTIAVAAAFGTILANAIIAIPGLLIKATEGLIDLARQGDQVNDVTRSFDLLNKKLGTTGQDELPKLIDASQGFADKLTLMQLQTRGLQDGLSRLEFRKIVQETTNLSQALGKDTVEAIDKVTQAITRGRTAGLATALNIDQQTLERVRLELSKTAQGFNDLSPAAQRLQIVLKSIEESSSLFGNALAGTGVGDLIDKIGNAFKNLRNDVAGALDNDDELVAFLKEVKHEIETTDPAAVIQGIKDIAYTAEYAYKIVANLVGALGNVITNADKYKGDFLTGAAKVVDVVDGVTHGFGFGVGGSPLGDRLRELATPHYQKQAEYDIQAQNARDEFQAKMAGLYDWVPGSDPKGENDRLHNPNSKDTTKSDKKRFDEISKALDELSKKRDEIFAKSQQQSDLLGLQKAIDSADGSGIEEFAKRINQSTSDQLYAGLKDTLAKAGLSRESKQFGEILAATINDNANKAILNVTQNISKNQQQVANQALQYQLDDALKKNNLAAVQDLQSQIEDADWSSAYKASLKQQLDNNVAVFQAYFLAGKEADSKLAIEHQQNAHRLEELQKQAFQNSVSFFEDLLSSAIDGTGKNLEQTLLEALKKIGIGFASQIGANLFPNLGGLTSAGGLGQALAVSLGFEGGGVKGIGDLFGSSSLTTSAAALTGSAGALTSAAGALTAAAGAQKIPGVPQGLTGSFLPAGGLSTLSATALSAGAVIVGVGAGAALLANGVKTGGVSGGVQGGLGGGLIGGSLFGGIGAGLLGPVGLLAGAFGGDLFGGNSQASQERQAREDLISSFKDKYGSASFNTIQGPYNLSKKDYNTDGLNPQSVGFAKPLAELFNGGNGKLTDDLAGIFGHGIDQAKNLNEEILNTQSLLSKMGTNADDAKSGLFALFKDGKIALNDFTEGIKNLDLVSQDTFQGPNGIQEGFAAIEEQLGNGTNQGLVGAVSGLSTEMNTFAKQGLKTTKEVADYFAKSGDTVKSKFFALLASQGYKTADDLKKALSNPDLFIQLLSDLQNAGDLSGQLGQNVVQTGSQGSSETQKLVGKTLDLTKAQQGFNQELQKTIDLYGKLGKSTGTGGTTTDPTADPTDPGAANGRGGGNPTGRTRVRMLNQRSAHGR